MSRAQLARLAAQLTEPAPDGPSSRCTTRRCRRPRGWPPPSACDRGELGAVLAGSDVGIVLAGHTHAISAGAVAGIPVWTGGATSDAADASLPRAIGSSTRPR